MLMRKFSNSKIKRIVPPLSGNPPIILLPSKTLNDNNIKILDWGQFGDC